MLISFAVLLYSQGRELLLTASDRIGVYRCGAAAVKLCLVLSSGAA